jgi:hypothetical protein
MYSPVPGNSYRNHTSMRVDHNVISPSFICIPIGEDLPKFISQKVKFYFETASIDSCKEKTHLAIYSQMSFLKYTRRESNPHRRNRNPIFYPLNYGCKNYLNDVLFQINLIVSLSIIGLIALLCSSERYPSRLSFSVNVSEPFSKLADTGQTLCKDSANL